MADVRFSDLWQATVEAIRSDFVYFIGFIVALTAIWVANDILMPDSLTLGSIGSAIITIVGQSVMIRRHLQRLGGQHHVRLVVVCLQRVHQTHDGTEKYYVYLS